LSPCVGLNGQFKEEESGLGMGNPYSTLSLENFMVALGSWVD